MGKVFKFCVLPIQSSDKSPCFYRGGKSSSGTDTFVRSMNAYLPRRLAYPIIVAAGMSDQCLLGFGCYPLIGIHSQLGKIRVGANSDFHISRSGFQTGGGVGSPNCGGTVVSATSLTPSGFIPLSPTVFDSAECFLASGFGFYPRTPCFLGSHLGLLFCLSWFVLSPCHFLRRAY